VLLDLTSFDVSVIHNPQTLPDLIETHKFRGENMLKVSDELASDVADLFPEETKENRIKRLIENE